MAAPEGNQNAAKGRVWRDAINRALAQRHPQGRQAALQALAEKLLTACEEGDLVALKELGDRVEGKAIQAVEVAGSEGGAIEQNLTVTFVSAATAGEA
jgi:hypothetical protein